MIHLNQINNTKLVGPKGINSKLILRSGLYSQSEIPTEMPIQMPLQRPERGRNHDVNTPASQSQRLPSNHESEANL